ncbi:MAG: SGNH/GDSL hydrolase family protein, partial [Planctomycetes bacterium]|nr:SGNH/GDSL hydrolase family protein [Planctomycetota bacterium]
QRVGRRLGRQVGQQNDEKPDRVIVGAVVGDQHVDAVLGLDADRVAEGFAIANLDVPALTGIDARVPYVGNHAILDEHSIAKHGIDAVLARVVGDDIDERAILGLVHDNAIALIVAQLEVGDGEVVAGFDGESVFSSTTFRWTNASGFETIGFNLRPRSVSDDGSIITSLFFPSFPLPDIREPHIWDSVNGDRLMLGALTSDFGIRGFSFGELDPDGLVSGDGTVFSTVGADWVAKVTPINFVSLGDSYSSGEGVEPFTDESNNPNNQCHRSLTAYPTLAQPRKSTKTLNELSSAGAGQPGFTWDFLACSQATIQNVSASGAGQYPGTMDTSPQLAQGVIDGDTDLVTITIGGNDLGFTEFVRDCVILSDCPNREADDLGIDWIVHLPQQIMGPFRIAVTALYQEIRAAAASNHTVVALGYPLLVSGRECPDLEWDVIGPFDPGISEAEQRFIRNMGIHLNQVLKDAANVAGIHFVGVFRDFASHEVCTEGGDPWINGIMDEQVFSFHPNEQGQAFYAAAVSAFLDQTGVGYGPGFFASGLPKNPAPQP